MPRRFPFPARGIGRNGIETGIRQENGGQENGFFLFIFLSRPPELFRTSESSNAMNYRMLAPK
jgi:hypothetical protein